MRLPTALILLATSSVALAEIETIPTDETAFLETIPHVAPSKVVELLGEPEKTITIRDEDSGEEIGAIVYYRYLNTNSEGEYYKTTELDYLRGRLMMVVFSNTELETADDSATLFLGGECAATC
ncbi:MAG: hypothetical protein N2Z69_08690 [Methylophilaceae bacterium]|nr:hypothetical protein [Methylophilaceae bacterium]